MIAQHIFMSVLKNNYVKMIVQHIFMTVFENKLILIKSDQLSRSQTRNLLRVLVIPTVTHRRYIKSFYTQPL